MSAILQPININIRPMRPADVLTVHQIEQETYPFPWSPGVFKDCLRTGYVCRVLDTADGLSGYAISSVGAGEAHILNLCISPGRRRLQLGTRFLQHLIDEIRQLGLHRIILEVRPSNKAAQRLYLQAGFSDIGTRPGYYPATNGREDAFVLELRLDTTPPGITGLVQ